MLDSPATDHGWLLLAPEGRPRTAKRFDSRESAVEERRPSLTVRYLAP